MLLGGREWLMRPPFCVWKDMFYVQTLPQSMLSWRARCLFPNDKICISLSDGVCWHDSRKKKKSHATAETGGWTAWDGRADKQKAPSLFISATFAFSAVALLHAKQGASAAEGGLKKKRKRSSDGESNWPESVSNVCIHGDTRQTGVGTRSVWEGHWQKKKVEREKKKAQAGVINHVSDAFTHSWGNEMRRNEKYLFLSNNSECRKPEG